MHIVMIVLQNHISYILGIFMIFGGCGLYNKKQMREGARDEGIPKIYNSSRSSIHIQKKGSRGFVGRESPTEKNWQEKLKELLEELPKHKKIILFLQPGLGEAVDTMHFLNRELFEKKSVIVYTLQDSSGNTSLQHPIEDLTQKVVDEIKKNIDLEFESIFLGLIGYSQGGIILQKVVNKMKEEEKVSDIFVVTINAPMCGVPVLTKTRQNIQDLFREESVRKGLRLSWGTIPGLDIDKAIRNMEGIAAILQSLAKNRRKFPSNYQLHGLYDLMPESRCLQDIKDLMEKDKSISKTCLFSRCDDLECLFKIKNNADVQQATSSFKKLIGEGPHDMLVPIYSQSGRTIRNETICRREITRGHHEYLAHARNVIVFGGLTSMLDSHFNASVINVMSYFVPNLGGSLSLTYQPVLLPDHIEVVLESSKTVEEILHSIFCSVKKYI